MTVGPITCRWGILSAAAIAKKNWRAISQTTGGTVVAVASRRKEAAEQFVRECSAHTPQTITVDALGSYDELLQRKDIDAVYIPLPLEFARNGLSRRLSGQACACRKACSTQFA